jgi:hypothetical protein
MNNSKGRQVVDLLLNHMLTHSACHRGQFRTLTSAANAMMETIPCTGKQVPFHVYANLRIAADVTDVDAAADSLFVHPGALTQTSKSLEGIVPARLAETWDARVAIKTMNAKAYFSVLDVFVQHGASHVHDVLRAMRVQCDATGTPATRALVALLLVFWLDCSTDDQDGNAVSAAHARSKLTEMLQVRALLALTDAC